VCARATPLHGNNELLGGVRLGEPHDLHVHEARRLTGRHHCSFAYFRPPLRPHDPQRPGRLQVRRDVRQGGEIVDVGRGEEDRVTPPGQPGRHGLADDFELVDERPRQRPDGGDRRAAPDAELLHPCLRVEDRLGPSLSRYRPDPQPQGAGIQVDDEGLADPSRRLHAMEEYRQTDVSPENQTIVLQLSCPSGRLPSPSRDAINRLAHQYRFPRNGIPAGSCPDPRPRFVDVRTGAVLNVVKVDGSASDIFSLQDRIAESLVTGLPLHGAAPCDAPARK